MTRQRMDPEVALLCQTINQFAGLRTRSSCSGHGEAPLSVTFTAATIRALFPLARAIDRRYGGPAEDWHIEVLGADLKIRPVLFVLRSTSQGPEAWEEAHMVVRNLEELQRREDVLAMYQIRLRPVPKAPDA